MEFLLKIHWMPYLALAVTLIAFVLISILSKKLGWTPVILIALVLGIGIGVLFASEDNAWLKWVDFLGKVYVRLLMLMVAPLISRRCPSGNLGLSSPLRPMFISS